MSAAIDIAAYVDLASAVLGMAIDPSHYPGVVVHFERIARMAELVSGFPLDPGIEPDPVSRA